MLIHINEHVKHGEIEALQALEIKTPRGRQVMFNVIITEAQLCANHSTRCSVSSTFRGDAISAWTSSHVQPVSGSLLDKHFQTVHVCT